LVWIPTRLKETYSNLHKVFFSNVIPVQGDLRLGYIFEFGLEQAIRESYKVQDG
jgi:hypothetical protein